MTDICSVKVSRWTLSSRSLVRVEFRTPRLHDYLSKQYKGASTASKKVCAIERMILLKNICHEQFICWAFASESRSWRQQLA